MEEEGRDAFGMVLTLAVIAVFAFGIYLGKA